MGVAENMSVHGLCNRDELHFAHTFKLDLTLDWHCPGQYSECRNCDDRKCMGCVFREYYHTCVNDCPECCK